MGMKLSITAIALAGLASITSACMPTDIGYEVPCESPQKIESRNIRSIEDARTLPSTCFKITETLEITGTALTDMSLFDGLKEVKNLIIKDNNNLTSLNGFNYVIVRGDLIIDGNPNLRKLEGITPDTTLTNLFIQHNDSLESITGFDDLKTIKNEFRFVNNAKLTSLKALKRVETIGDVLEISDNTGLKKIGGFGRLSGPKKMLFVNNSSLTTIDGFSAPLFSIEELRIKNNRALTTAFALSGNLETITNTITIVNNPALSDCRVADFEEIDYPLGADDIQGNGVAWDPC